MSRTSATKSIAIPDHSRAADWRREPRSGVSAGDDERWLDEHESAPRTAFAAVVGVSVLGGSLIWGLAGYVIYRLVG